jgi:hypothetical protein
MKKFFTMPAAAAVLITVFFVFARCESSPMSLQPQPAAEEACTTAAQLAVSLKDGYAEVDVNDEGTVEHPCAITNNGSSIYFIVDGNEVLIIDGGNGGIDGYGLGIIRLVPALLLT